MRKNDVECVKKKLKKSDDASDKKTTKVIENLVSFGRVTSDPKKWTIFRPGRNENRVERNLF